MKRSQLRLLLSLLVLSSIGFPIPVRAGGWVDKRPSKIVQLDPGPGLRNSLFYVGEPIRFALKGDGADRYEVRDYWGTLVDQGKSAATITLKAQPPGWYKLYLFAPPMKEPVRLTKDQQAEAELADKVPDAKIQETLEKDWAVRKEWGDACGGTTFVVFRDDKNFPRLPDKSVIGSGDGISDEPMRGVAGIGPQRLYCDLNKKIDDEIKRIDVDVALDKEYYLAHDPVRHRALMLAFSNGTKGKEKQLKKVVEHFKDSIKYYEPRNEPNGGSNGADFVKNELEPFYETIKSVDPSLKVMGPGTVSIGLQLQQWLEDFFKADGGKYIDVFSFHAYNTLNGDLFLSRWSMDSLQALLKKYGLEKIEKWQTEQGYFACVYGVYQPQHQGRWTMLEMMVYEQYGIPKEHNDLWYDRSHGFWDFPTWWENDDGSFNPAVPLMRVWSEELFGKHFTKAYDLGPSGNKLYIGSLFSGDGNSRVAAFMGAGDTEGSVQLKVTGGPSVKVVSAFGVESSLKVENGMATLRVPELPVYVELPPGTDISPVAQDFGPNLAMQAGVTSASSGSGKHPVDPKIPNDITKLINGKFENWYWTQKSADQPWMDDTKEFPAWVEIRLPKKEPIGRVVIYTGVPWQWMGTLLDYELQVADDAGIWKTIEHVKQDPATFKVLTPVLRCGVDSFAGERWIFNHAFTPVTTDKIRLLVHDTTYGGGATKDCADTGGQTGPHQVNLREIEVYGG